MMIFMRGLARTWMPWVTLVLAVVTGAGLLLHFVVGSISNLESRNNWVLHTRDVLDQTKTIWSAIVDAESGVRGYALTGDDQYLEHYKNVRQTTAIGVQHLALLVQDNSDQEQNIADFKAAVATKLDRMDLLVATRREKGLLDTQKLVFSKTGVVAMDRVRTIADRIVSVENRLLALRISDAARSSQSSFWVIVVAVLTLTSLILGAALASVAPLTMPQRNCWESNHLRY
jgi:methyl-accepting chemotaxis protein